MSYVQSSKKILKTLVSELEQSQEQPGNTSETFMSSQDHSDGARVAPYVEILKIVIFCLIYDLRRTFFKERPFRASEGAFFFEKKGNQNLSRLHRLECNQK